MARDYVKEIALEDLDAYIESIESVDVDDLPTFLDVIPPIVVDMVRGDILGAIMRNSNAVIEATAIGARVDRAWLGAQKPDVLVELASRVLEVNWDFFVQRVLPAINQAAERLARIVSGGTSGSPDSSAQDSTTQP